MRSSDRDRQAVAMRLHSGTVQELSAGQLATQAALRQVPERAPRQLLEIASRGVGNALAEVLDIAGALHPEDISAARLRSAVDKLVAPLRVQGVTVDITVQLDVAASADVMAAVYRCIRECMWHIHRDARTSVVGLRVLGDHEGISIRIVNDDSGFDRRCAKSAELNGVQLAGELARSIGGTSRVSSSVGHTTIEIMLPIQR